jgi:hypothetical protein
MSRTRRLAAILAADVAGYSRLMGADEEGTHERLKAHLVLQRENVGEIAVIALGPLLPRIRGPRLRRRGRRSGHTPIVSPMCSPWRSARWVGPRK